MSSVKVMKHLWFWHMAVVEGPHTSVCTLSPKFWADGLVLTLGTGRQVAYAKMYVLQSPS